VKGYIRNIAYKPIQFNIALFAIIKKTEKTKVSKKKCKKFHNSNTKKNLMYTILKTKKTNIITLYNFLVVFTLH